MTANPQLCFLVFGAICTGAATLIGLLHSEYNNKPMHLWTLVVGLIFSADVFALASQPAAPTRTDAPFVVAERILTVADTDGHNRIESPGLMLLAQKQAERNATSGNPKGHTDLNLHVGQYGVMAENAGTSSDWEWMYKVWHKSGQHHNNIESDLKYIGYAVETSPKTGQKCFVVLYSSRRGEYIGVTGESK